MPALPLNIYWIYFKDFSQIGSYFWITSLGHKITKLWKCQCYQRNTNFLVSPVRKKIISGFIFSLFTFFIRKTRFPEYRAGNCTCSYIFASLEQRKCFELQTDSFRYVVRRKQKHQKIPAILDQWTNSMKN